MNDCIKNKQKKSMDNFFLFVDKKSKSSTVNIHRRRRRV